MNLTICKKKWQENSVLQSGWNGLSFPFQGQNVARSFDNELVNPLLPKARYSSSEKNSHFLTN